MPQLPDPTKTLTAGEAIERLKKNPDDPDPDVQAFKKSIESFSKKFMPSEYQLAMYGKVIQEAVRRFNSPLILESIVQAKENMERMVKILDGQNIANALTKIGELPKIEPFVISPLEELSTPHFVPVSPEVETQRKLNQVNANLERMISLLEKSSKDKTTNNPASALLSALPPNNKKNKDIWKVARLLVINTRVSNYQLARSIFTYIKSPYDYKSKRDTYIKGVENRIRILRRIFKPLGFIIKMKTSPETDYSEILFGT